MLVRQVQSGFQEFYLTDVAKSEYALFLWVMLSSLAVAPRKSAIFCQTLPELVVKAPDFELENVS